jgi:hypothetical protein
MRTPITAAANFEVCVQLRQLGDVRRDPTRLVAA